MQKLIITNPGHGGINKYGRYTTAPGKMFTHERGNFHKGSTVYEGVLNRNAEKLLHIELAKRGISYISTVELARKHVDLPLWNRYQIENQLYGQFDTLFLDLHHNATETHEARGFTVWTFPGKSNSDIAATDIFENTQKNLGNRIKYLTDKSDGDVDFEARFYLLRKTIGPAVTIEYQFFDQIDDCLLAFDPKIQKLFAKSVAETCENFCLNQLF